MRGLQQGHTMEQGEVDPTDSVCQKFPSTPVTIQECKATVHCMGQSITCTEALPCQMYMTTMSLVPYAMSAVDLWSTLYQRGMTALQVGHSSTKDT